LSDSSERTRNVATDPVMDNEEEDELAESMRNEPFELTGTIKTNDQMNIQDWVDQGRLFK
jgi:hypothetical protein